MLESNDIPLNYCETAESVEMNNSIASSNKIISDLGRTSRFGRKIKSNRLSDRELVTKESKHLKLKKVDSQTLETNNSGNDETDDVLKQNVKIKGKILIIFFSVSRYYNIICLLKGCHTCICCLSYTQII